MSRISRDTLLQPNIFNIATYSKLKWMLSDNDAWREVALSCGVFSNDDIRNIGFTKEPAEKLVFELGARLCNVGFFCEILKICRLYNILALFEEYDPINIIEQPCYGKEDKMVIRGTELKLTCKGTGIPSPSYQWFCNSKKLEGQREPVLHIHDFGEEHEGEYYCLLNQEGFDSVKQSSKVSVSLAPEKPIITVQPSVSTICKVGTKVSLYVCATGHPNVKYQWFKENTQLNGRTDAELTLDIKDESKDGTYRCYVYNTAGEAWSNESVVTVYALPHPEPSAKAALLIANQLYDNLNRLKTPENDVKTLAHILQGLGFSTISLQNLDLTEMRGAIYNFAELLPENAYVVFYFSGHGFEMCDKFMLPVNAPGPEDYLQTHAVCERELLKTILKSRPKVFLELLDMCLKPPDQSNKKIFEEKTSHYEYEASHNLIQGYATTSYSSAYEKRSDENGMYVKHLKEYFTKRKDMPIVEILRNVAKDIAKVCPIQKPFFGTNVTMDYRLTDPCSRSSGNCGMESKVKNLHELPVEFKYNFTKAKVASRVTFRHYLGVFLNTLEIRMSDLEDFRVWCRSCKTIRSEISRVNGDVVIKVFDLQKMVNSIIVIELSDADGRFVDNGGIGFRKTMFGATHLCQRME